MMVISTAGKRQGPITYLAALRLLFFFMPPNLDKPEPKKLNEKFLFVSLCLLTNNSNDQKFSCPKSKNFIGKVLFTT